MKRFRAACLVLLAALALPADTRAQVRLWVDAFGSTAQPPADVIGDASTYGIGGLRLEWLTPRSHLETSVQAGTGAGDAGRWLDAELFGFRHWTLGPSTIVVEGEALLLRYSRPFRYSAGNIGLKPRIISGLNGIDLELFGGGSIGHWSAAHTVEADGDLHLLQIGTAANVPVGPATFRLSLSTTRATNGADDGWYREAETSLTASHGAYQALLAAQLQRHGGENEFGFALTVQREVFRSARIHASVARTVRDPQLGTPAQLGFTLGVRVPLLARNGFRSAVTPVAEVLGATQGGRRVRFTVRASASRHVQLVGSFTDWQPTAMRKNGECWTAVLTVPAGSHQFAFLLDGETWFVPEDAPGVVDDGFGRRNATLLVS